MTTRRGIAAGALLVLLGVGCGRAPERSAASVPPTSTPGTEAAETPETADAARTDEPPQNDERPPKPGEVQTSRPGSGSPSAAAERLNRLGRFYMVAGPQDVFPHLFAMDWQDLEPQPLGPDSVTNTAACEDLVVAVFVTRRDEKSPTVHRLARVTASGLRPVEDTGEIYGSAMAFDSACRVNYVALVDGGDRYDVRSFDVTSRRMRTVYSSDEPVGRLAWFGDTLIARVGMQSDRWRIVAIKDGKARNLNVKLAPGEAFHLARSGWLAIALPVAEDPVTRLYNVADGRELRVEGWTAVAWLPDGDELFVRNDEELALVSVPSLRVEEIGRWRHERIWSGAWAS